MRVKIARIAGVTALSGLVLMRFYPVNDLFSRLALLGCLSGFWAGLVLLIWKWKSARIAALLLPLVPAVALSLPGRTIDVAELRRDYVRRMSGFEGTEYRWGGESPQGIDCSGLPRRALRDALLVHALRHANGRAFRAGLENWWFDASANALREGYRGYTRALGIGGTIRKLDDAGLLPGDLAITSHGIHVLAYAGDGKWIQADPGTGTVVTLDAKMDDNGWFDAPVTIHRWTLLDPG